MQTRLPPKPDETTILVNALKAAVDTLVVPPGATAKERAQLSASVKAQARRARDAALAAWEADCRAVRTQAAQEISALRCRADEIETAAKAEAAGLRAQADAITKAVA